MGSLTRASHPESQVNHDQENFETRQESSPKGKSCAQGQAARNEEGFSESGTPDAPG
jgi:hypothetical protein